VLLPPPPHPPVPLVPIEQIARLLSVEEITVSGMFINVEAMVQAGITCILNVLMTIVVELVVGEVPPPPLLREEVPRAIK